MTKQEMFEKLLSSKKTVIQNSWWTYKTLEGDYSYWQFERSMALDFYKLAMSKLSLRVNAPILQKDVFAAALLSGQNKDVLQIMLGITSSIPSSATSSTFQSVSNNASNVAKYSSAMSYLYKITQKLPLDPKHGSNQAAYVESFKKALRENSDKFFEKLKTDMLASGKSLQSILSPLGFGPNTAIEHALNRATDNADEEFQKSPESVDFIKASLQEIESVYLSEYINLYYAVYMCLDIDAKKKAAKAQYDKEVMDFATWLVDQSKDPELMVPTIEQIRNEVESTQKPSPIMPVTTIPEAPQAEAKPPLMPAVNLDLNVVDNKPNQVEAVEGKKSSFVPVAIAAAAAAFFLLK